MTTPHHLVPRVACAALSVGAAAALLHAAPALAQGSLSGQGYGYPTGELSSRAIATGGSLGEFDPASPINPAAIGSWGASPVNSAVRQWWGRTAFTFQYDPEFRRVTSGGSTQGATLTRFPLVAIAIPVRSKFEIGASAATLLDRTFSTQVPSSFLISGQTVTGTQTIESRGAMEDVRLALAYNPFRRLSLGVAGHIITGQNRVVSGRTFTDTTQFGTVSDSTAVDFTGGALSAGAELRPIDGFSIAGSYRKGGTLRAERSDTTLRRANVPDRWGVGVRVDRLPGASITASYSFTSWTNMNGLGASTLHATDAPEFALGAEAVGPHVGSSALLLRLGGRKRTLPFGVGGADVRETAIAGGISAPFNVGHAVLDLTVQHATRTPDGGTAASTSERAWTLSIGLTVRP